LDWLKDMPIPNTRGNVSNTEMDYMAKVPFRSIGR
jgi:phycobilisome rod-core linker protein